MSTRIIDGKAIAEAVDLEVASEVRRLVETHGEAPCLCVVLVGDDPASQVYVRNKGKRTQAAGMISREIKLPATISQSELEVQVKALSADPLVDGI